MQKRMKKVNSKRKEVKGMRKSLIFCLMFLITVAVSAPANAVIIVNDWTLNLNGIDGITESVSNISQITFVGIVHAQLRDTNGNGQTDVGEFSFTDGLLAATSFVDTWGSIILGTGLNNTYQITFDFSADTYNWFIDPVTGAVHFSHVAPTDANAVTDGLLDIWVDGPAGGVTSASINTGAGYTDGVKIATFVIQTGDGGVFSPATFDGSDDATFKLVWAYPGVILDSDGNDMASDPSKVLFALTDSNFDADPTHTPNIGFTIPTPTLWPFPNKGAGTPASFFAQEDGSARIGVRVPEPSTLLLLGAGLLGIGVLRRRQTTK